MGSETQKNILKERLGNIGYELSEKDFESVYNAFDDLVRVKTPLGDGDLHMLVQELLIQEKATTGDLIVLKRIDYCCEQDGALLVRIILSQNGIESEANASGRTLIETIWAATTAAIFKEAVLLKKDEPEELGSFVEKEEIKTDELVTTNEATLLSEAELRDFKIFVEPRGLEANELVTVCIENNGKMSFGRGFNQDVMRASAEAVVSAINHLLYVPVEQPVTV